MLAAAASSAGGFSGFGAFDDGRMVRLVVDEMDIVVASNRSQSFDREPFLALGIHVLKYKYVALKSSNHFRAGFSNWPRSSPPASADCPGGRPTPCLRPAFDCGSEADDPCPDL